MAPSRTATRARAADGRRMGGRDGEERPLRIPGGGNDDEELFGSDIIRLASFAASVSQLFPTPAAEFGVLGMGRAAGSTDDGHPFAAVGLASRAFQDRHHHED